MEPIIDHIEITVRDITVAVRFYDKLLPLLGFDLGTKSTARIEDHEKDVVSYEHPRLGFAITSPRRAFSSRAALSVWLHLPGSSPGAAVYPFRQCA